MKKIWPLLLLVCSLQTGLQAQTIRYSSERKFDYNKYSQNIIGWMGDRLFVFQTNSDGATLNAYNDSMQLKAIVNLDFIQDKVYGAQFYAYPDRMIALYQENDYGKISQFATVLNTKGMIIKRPLSVGNEKSGLFSSKTTFFEYAISPDRSKIMIIAPSVKGKTAKLICTMIDTSLKVLNKKTLTFKADDDVVVNNFVLGNDGSFYALAFTPIGKKGFAEQAWILSAAREERKFNSLEIDKNDNRTLFLNGVKMKLDPVNGKLLLGGFFSLKKNGNTDGTLVGSYMADSSSVSPEYTVAKNFDNKAREAMGVKNREQAFDDYKVRDILVKNDGSIILISENQIVTYFNDYPSGFMYSPAYYYYGMPYASTSTRYYYGNILLLNLKEDGNPAWMTLIQKSQLSTNDNGVQGSYGFLNSGGSLVFLYNTGRGVELAAVNAINGKLSLQDLGETDVRMGAWLPRQAVQTDAKEVFVPILKSDDRTLLGRINF